LLELPDDLVRDIIEQPMKDVFADLGPLFTFANRRELATARAT